MGRSDKSAARMLAIMGIVAESGERSTWSSNGPALIALSFGLLSLLAAPFLTFVGILAGLAAPAIGATFGIWGLLEAKRNDPPKGRILAVAGLSLSVLIMVLMSGIWLAMLDSNSRVNEFARRFCAVRPPPRSTVLECAGDLTKESASGNSCDLRARATIESALPVERLRLYYARALGMRIYPEPFLRQPMEAYDGFEDGNVYVAVHGSSDDPNSTRQRFLAEAYQLAAVDGDWRCQ